MTTKKDNLKWIKALEPNELPNGRVKTVTVGTTSICMTHHDNKYGALDNKCPHQGGPLGEGSIENGLLRCPWHGWDFCPHSGKAPGFDDGVDTYPLEEREDGIYIGLTSDQARQRTVADVMAETMVNWGVNHVFGMVGHSNLGLADALRVQEEAGNLTFIGIRHEGAASFAVSAYGKLTGKLSACLTIAGPGATNLLTGLWDANVDRAPALALTGQVDTQVLGPGAFQEVDLNAAFGKVAQWSQSVLSDSNHAELMTLACKSALLNRGVSHLIFPDEVQPMPADDSAKAQTPTGRMPNLNIAPSEESLNEAISLLKKSKKPVFIVGHGARYHMPAIIQLAETLKSPVMTTFKGKGLIPDTHPLACGVLGRSGTPVASYFMNESDCLVVFGASFSNHTGITPKKPTIQIDFDPMALGKFHKIDVPVLGEISVTTQLLQMEFSKKCHTEDRTDEIKERQTIWRAEKKSRQSDNTPNGLSSATIFEVLSHKVPRDAIIAVDVGNNTYSFGRYFECQSQPVLMSGYLGSIGFSLPAAIGAWAATQEDDPKYKGRKVISISGDGGFGQYMGEVATAVKYNMNITHILLNNGELGKISKEQRAGQWDVWQTSLVNPNFSAYVNSYPNTKGIRVETNEALESAIDEAFAHNGFSLVEIMADPLLV